jgi:steroid delta-isomerase-like uncharacterized protein
MPNDKRFYIVSLFALAVVLGIFNSRAISAVSAQATADGPLAANKQLLLRVYDAFNTGKVDDLDAFVAKDFVDHTPGIAPGLEGLKQSILGARAAFPDLKIIAEDLIAEGDKVVSRGSWTGTQTGPFGGLPPNGKKVMVSGIDIIRIENGMIVEHWEATDNLGLLQQLGVIPPMGGAPATEAPK